jgi:hypothetical protein
MSPSYSKKEYDKMVKMYEASDKYIDASSEYVTGKRQTINQMFNGLVDQIRTAEYILEELKAKVGDIREEVRKL